MLTELHNHILELITNQNDQIFLIDLLYNQVILQDLPEDLTPLIKNGMFDWQQVFGEVRTQITQTPDLRDRSWQTMYLPLLVLCAKVGYEYKGSDYWPMLANELSVDGGVSLNNQQELTKWFQTVETHQNPTIIGNSAWERQFTQICYPIGHAIIPKRLHHRLFDVIADFPYTITNNMSQSVLIDALRRYCVRKNEQSSLLRLLEQPQIVEDLFKHVLDNTHQPQLLSVGFLTKVQQDIQNDYKTQRSFDKATTNQRNHRSNGRFLDIDNERHLQVQHRRCHAHTSARLIFDKGAFNRETPSNWLFRLEPPSLPEDIRKTVIQSTELIESPLLKGRHKLCDLWLDSKTVRNRYLIKAIQKQTTLPIPLFHEKSLSALPAQLWFRMDKYRVDLQFPLLFDGYVEDSKEELVQMTRGLFSMNKKYTLVHSETELGVNGVIPIGSFGNQNQFTIFTIDTSQPDAVKWLMNTGLWAIETITATVLSPPTFIGPKLFKEGGLHKNDFAAVKLTGSAQINVSLDSKNQYMVNEGLHKLPHNQSRLEVDNRLPIAISRVNAPPIPPLLFNVHQTGGSSTKNNLMSGRINIQISSPYSIQHIPITIRFRTTLQDDVLFSLSRTASILPFDISIPNHWADALEGDHFIIETLIGNQRHVIKSKHEIVKNTPVHTDQHTFALDDYNVCTVTTNGTRFDSNPELVWPTNDNSVPVLNGRYIQHRVFKQPQQNIQHIFNLAAELSACATCVQASPLNMDPNIIGINKHCDRLQLEIAKSLCGEDWVLRKSKDIDILKRNIGGMFYNPEWDPELLDLYEMNQKLISQTLNEYFTQGDLLWMLLLKSMTQTTAQFYDFLVDTFDDPLSELIGDLVPAENFWDLFGEQHGVATALHKRLRSIGSQVAQRLFARFFIPTNFISKDPNTGDITFTPNTFFGYWLDNYNNNNIFAPNHSSFMERLWLKPEELTAYSIHDAHSSIKHWHSRRPWIQSLWLYTELHK